MNDEDGRSIRGGPGLSRLGVAVGLATLALWTPLATGASVSGGGPTAQSVLGSGALETQSVMHQLDGLYLFSPGCQQLAQPGTNQWLDFSCLSPDPAGTITTENYEHDQVHEAHFLSSDIGITQLCSQGQSGVAHIDFARSARGPRAGDCAGLRFVQYGTNAYNVYCTAACPGGASSAATVNYVGEDGWICKTSANHATNPVSKNNYRTDIASAITAAGITPLSLGPVGGGDTNSDFCRLTTPPLTQVGDFDGDGRTDLTVFRPSSGEWFTSYSSGIAYGDTTWGTSGDVPVAADYDGAGRSQQAVYRSGTWYVRHANGSYTATVWGLSTDIPVPADYDGTGRAQIAVYRPGSGEWFVRHADGTYADIVWGVSTDVPVPANYDGTGHAQIAVYRPGSGEWFVRHADGTYADIVWGVSTDVPVPGDYDAAGSAQMAVYRPNSGEWFIRHGNGSYADTVWGRNGDIPQPGDYDGDGRTDFTVYRPGSTGVWYVLPAPGATYTAPGWGTTGDIPTVLPAAVRKAYFP